ncbi:MAG: hypothetical protein U1E76_27190 [Planctomycetota bacterium]
MKIDQLKRLIQLPRNKIERYTREHPESSLVWEGLVVKEFMEERGIAETTLAVRQFYAFKRQMLAQLGMEKQAS